MIRHEESRFFPPLNVRFLPQSLIYLSPALTALWEAAKLGCYTVHDVLSARLTPTLGAGAGIIRSGLSGLGSSSATDHDAECKATAILYRGWRA